jgi:type IV pilus assembly protein PilB
VHGVGKFDLDNILSELGVKGDDAPAARQRKKGDDRADRKKHTIDKAESSFTSLPAVPSGQRSFGNQITVEHDPAVPVRTVNGRAVGGETLSTVYQPDADDHAGARADLGQFLASKGAVTAQQLTAAQQVLKQAPGRRLVDLLIEQGADEGQVHAGVADFAGVPFERVDLAKGLDGGFDGTLLQRLTTEFCKENLVLPLRVEQSAMSLAAGAEGIAALRSGRVVIGVTRPDDVFLFDEIRRRLDITIIRVVVVTPSDVLGALQMVGGAAAEASEEDVSSILADVQESDVEVEKASDSNEAIDLEKAGEAPVIRYVNLIIQSAVKEGASDIHIEPSEKRLKVRYRIDGVLFEMMQAPGSMSAAIISRLKIMGNLDIAERRIPQDGRIRCAVQGRKLDLRMSTIPSAYGEKVVLRILDTKSINVQLEQLGFDETTLITWKRAIDEPHGIVLVTGPTGSGKTTTLYASLKQLDKNTMNVSTVEDPIEYHLEGITQTQTHEKIGMTFAKALKALLRQDPDVIMLGEIRDQETAHTAIQAALTGHLVLSTLHTNDAPSSITRLVNIGTEPFLVGAAIRGVLAQRLVRRLCAHCKGQDEVSEERAEYFSFHGIDPKNIWASRGCDRCRNTGYSGRVGIYEMLAVDDHLRDIIARNPNVAEFRRLCIERGMVTLRQDGLSKAGQGLTSVEEVLRATEAAA